MGNKDAYTLGLLTNNVTRLLIDAAGNVGIGSLTPTATLDVNGTLHVTQICDQNGANCKTVSGGWGAGGSVTYVGTGTGLVAGAFSTYGTLAVDVGTTANKILQLTAGAQIPGVDGYLITNVNAANISGKQVSATAPSAGQVLTYNNSTSKWDFRGHAGRAPRSRHR